MEMGFQSVTRRSSAHHIPESRKMWTSQMSVPSVTENLDIPDLPFLRKASYLYKMCPLVNFERKKSAFKRYEASLVSYCNSYTQNQSYIHSAVFEVIEGLNIYSADPEAVYFAIIQKTEVKDKALLCGLLTCVELSPEFEELHETYTYYPLMILTGNMKLRRIVQMWFQKEFQGKSSPMVLSPVDLTWVLSLWTGKINESGDNNRQVHLGFHVTEEGIDDIDVEIESKDLKKLWNTIHPDPQDKMFTISQVNAFMEEIERFFYNAFKLRLGMLQLSKVMTTIASVTSNGVFKLHSQDYIVDVLRLLCSFSAEKLAFMWQFFPHSDKLSNQPTDNEQ